MLLFFHKTLTPCIFSLNNDKKQSLILVCTTCIDND